MSVKIKFLGIAAYEIIINERKKILIDPCLDDNPVSPLKVKDLDRIDLVLVTHLAFDHLGDTANIAKKCGCKVVCGAEVKYFLEKEGVNPEQMRTLTWGIQLIVEGIRVRSVMSCHASMRIDRDGGFLCGLPMGFIIYAESGIRIYHSGDTAIYSDLRLVGELYKPNIALISCCKIEKDFLEKHGILDHYTSEMNGDEGALAALWLRVEYALCNHYLKAKGHHDVEKFISILTNRTSDEEPVVKPVVLEPGEVFVYPP